MNTVALTERFGQYCMCYSTKLLDFKCGERHLSDLLAPD